MTTFLPLESGKPLPSTPSFLVAPSDPEGQIAKVIRAILKAKRVVVVCGAGISVQAGIPDFRSPEGLFQTLKRDNPREQLTSGRDLFDASVFSSEQTTSLFCQMIARLSSLSMTATPTPFHHVLRSLDDRGKLLRVYTQNIDAIEVKAGLSFGVPESRPKPRPKNTSAADDPSTARLPSPPLEIPRCIPLHGSIQTVHCQTCTHKFPLEDHLPSLEAGTLPQCPECTQMEETRQVVGKRARGIGRLRPSVVLYNEMHQDGEGVGDIVQKDLMGSSKGKGRSGADLLLVVGTSLRVPGTKRMVREFSKAVRVRAQPPPKDSSTPGAGPSSPRRSPMNEEEPSIRSVYLNLDFPVPTREWDGVFDAWVQGDAQTFTEMLHAEIKREAEIKEQALERKKKREEDAAMAQGQATGLQTPNPSPQSNKRKNPIDGTASNSTKKRRFPTSNSLPLHDTSDSPLFKKSKIVLRIPPRLKWIPEVVISSKPHTLSKRAVQSPLTPPRTPPRKMAKPSRASKRHRPKGKESDTPTASSSSSSSPSHPLISLSTRIPSSVQSILAAG